VLAAGEFIRDEVGIIVVFVSQIQARQAVELARGHHRAGRLGDAREVYRAVLDRFPDDPDALAGLGLVTFALGDAAGAIPLLSRAVAASPDRAELHYNLGVLLNSVKRPGEAIASFRAAIKLKPDFHDAVFNLGVVLQSQGELSEAIGAYRRVIEIVPYHVWAYINLGSALTSAGNLPEALGAFESACRIHPALPEVHFNRGNILRVRGKPAEAIEAYRQATTLRPKWADAWISLAVAYRSLQQPGAAAEAYQKALEISPNLPKAWWSLGVIFDQQQRRDEAMNCFKRAIELDANFAAAQASLGTVIFFEGQREEGLAAMRRAVALDPKDASIHWKLGQMLLAMGHWSEGWEEFEWRFRVAEAGLDRGFAQPQWDGSAATGKTLLLYAEGGHGDAIQFVRYLPMCAGSGAKIVLECHEELVELLGQIPGVNRVVARGSRLPDFDLQSSLVSLPRVLEKDAAAASEAYLVAPVDRVEKFRSRISSDSGLKVGLVWAGRPLFADARSRSIDVFAPLAEIAGVKFFGLQKGAEASQKPPGVMELIDLTQEIFDYSDAAGAVACLDLVISVDTGVAHLAAAMGKSTWMLVPWQSDFRWLLDREDSPWYPALRLFRQPANGDWGVPVLRMADALRAIISRRSS
jgi:tetratricopeptide (TPR) repeat protein